MHVNRKKKETTNLHQFDNILYAATQPNTETRCKYSQHSQIEKRAAKCTLNMLELMKTEANGKKNTNKLRKKMFVVWFLDYSGWLLSVTQWSM